MRARARTGHATKTANQSTESKTVNSPRKHTASLPVHSSLAAVLALCLTLPSLPQKCHICQPAKGPCPCSMTLYSMQALATSLFLTYSGERCRVMLQMAAPNIKSRPMGLHYAASYAVYKLSRARMSCMARSLLSKLATKHVCEPASLLPMQADTPLRILALLNIENETVWCVCVCASMPHVTSARFLPARRLAG